MDIHFLYKWQVYSFQWCCETLLVSGSHSIVYSLNKTVKAVYRAQNCIFTAPATTVHVSLTSFCETLSGREKQTEWSTILCAHSTPCQPYRERLCCLILSHYQYPSNTNVKVTYAQNYQLRPSKF